MAATNFTPISLYYSTTASAVPSAGNLVAGELALNTVDEKLYFKNSAGTVKLLAANITPVANGGTGLSSTPSNGQLDIGNGTGFTRATLTAGSGVTITNGSGAITINATGTGGDVVGPASAVANSIALFNSTTGKLIKDSSASDGLIYGLTVGRGAGAVVSNTAVGVQSIGNASNTGTALVGIGYEALQANTTGGSNTAIGYRSSYLNTTGQQNLSAGVQSFRDNTTGSFNVALGVQALQSNTTASNNTAVGYQAAYANTTGTDNTAVGYASLYSNQTGVFNTAVGYGAGYSSTAGGITAIGNYALNVNTTGVANVAVGGRVNSVTTGTLVSNTTGSYNTGIGAGALSYNTTASNNTAVGYQALYTNTTASQSTAVGYQAGFNQVGAGGDYNSLLGYRAGFTNVTGAVNTYIGTNSGYLATTSSNTFVGVEAGYYITSGAKNTIIGRYTGNQGGLDIRTASNYIVLSDGDGNPRFYSNDTGVLYDLNGKLRAVPQSGSSKTSSYTLATTDVGEYILLGASGAIVIPDATFAAGDIITIFNNTGSTATITCSITTAYIAGTFTDKATMTLAAAGVATVLFITSTLCVVSGNVT